MKNFKSDHDPTSILYVLENKLTLTCDMCNHPVLHPQICPACNQIFCYQCLFKYHQNNKNCPLCHEKLTLNQFLEFDSGHVLQFFRKQLKDLKLNKETFRSSMRQEAKRFGVSESNKNEKQKDQEEKCPDHDVPLRYFCETCSKAICSDCGMMSNHHKNHKFIRLNDIYTKIKQKLNNELRRLSKKITDSQQNSSNIKKKLQKLQSQHAHIKRYAEEYYVLLIEKLEDEISAKTNFLKEMQEKNNAQVEFYERIRDGICDEIQCKSKFQLIKDSNQILTSFTIQACEPPEPLKIEESFQTIKELLPQYNDFQYTLQNFSLCTGGIVYSDPFLLNGVEWRLKIYPKGNGVAKGKYLSVFVEMTKAEKSQKKYEYKIQLICKEFTSQNIRREYCSAFDIGQCWGYNQFISLEDLISGFLDEDKLHFIMGIRSPDYSSLSQDQSNYILKLQNEIKLKELERYNEIQETNIIDELENNSYSTKNNHSNDTKFLKFLENSSLNEERINERKQKEKQKQRQKSQKDQEYDDFHELLQFTLKKQQRTTNNLQISDVVEVKPQKNDFFIKDYCSEKSDDFQYDQSEFRPKNKETLKRTKQTLSKEEDDDDDDQKSKNSIAFNQKQFLLKDKKIEKLHLKESEQKIQQKKSEKPLRTDFKAQSKQKYEMYFSSSKKLETELIKKDHKKQEKQNLQEENSFKRQSKNAQSSKVYKNQLKEIKKSIETTKAKLKFEEEKPKRIDEERTKRYEEEKMKKYEEQKEQKRTQDQRVSKKYEDVKSKGESKEQIKFEEQKKETKTKKYIKSSPPKTKNEIEENEKKKKQISSILEQSKKLEGISEEKVNNFLSNMSEVKDPNGSGSILRSPVKTSQIRHEKEESKPSLRKLKEFEFERN